MTNDTDDPVDDGYKMPGSGPLSLSFSAPRGDGDGDGDA